MTDVFVSYSRKDKTFVQKLHEALILNQKDAWVDWEDIPLTTDWWAEIQEGIEAGNAFVFVISPDSVTSKVCSQELEHAVKHNKRLIPLVYRDAEGVPDVLGHLNWIFCRETDNFDEAFKSLLEVMDTDYDWVKAHTRLTTSAVYWTKKEHNESYLLRGDELAEAEQHLSQPNRKPALTQLQQAYIVASQQQQAVDLMHELEQAKALAKTEKQRLEEQQRYNSQLRRRSMIIIGALVAVIVLGIFAVFTAVQNGTLTMGTEEVVDTMVEFANAQALSDMCWAGALNGLSTRVMPACDQAVALEPDVAEFRESRALARALEGSYPGSLSDFRTAIEITRDFNEIEDRIVLWEDWARQLEQGSNPFDETILQQLRDDWEAEKQFSDTEESQ
jgi:tetratricopeptide (TPR) repeat protein